MPQQQAFQGQQTFQNQRAPDPNTDAKQKIYEIVAQMIAQAMQKLMQKPDAFAQVFKNILRGGPTTGNLQSNYRQGNI